MNFYRPVLALGRSLARLRTLIIFATALALTSAAFGQGKSAVTVDLTARKIAFVDGKESLESAEKAKPGDVIQYAATYRNTSTAAVKNLQATVPIPQGLELIADSAKPEAAQASVDGNNFKPMPLTEEV